MNRQIDKDESQDLDARLRRADPVRGLPEASLSARRALVHRDSPTAQRARASRPRRIAIATAAAAAIFLAAITFAWPARRALAWSPTSSTSAPAAPEQLRATCTENLPITQDQLATITDGNLKIVDARGNASLVVWATPALHLYCLVLEDPAGGVVRGPAMLAEPRPTDAEQLSVEFMAGTDWLGETVMVAYGRAPKQAVSVFVVGQTDEEFAATIDGEGNFAVWWPSSRGAGTGNIVAKDADGTVIGKTEIAAYFTDSASRQPDAPAAGQDGNGEGSSPLSTLPGDGAMNVGPMPSRRPSTGLARAELRDVRVPDEVVAGTALVVRFRMLDAQQQQAPVAFIGGPPGWISSWCGFGISAVRTSGSALDGEYEVSCLVPESAPSTTYSVGIGCECVFSDMDGQPTWRLFDFKVVGGSSDTTPPVLVGATLEEARPITGGSTFRIVAIARDESEISYVFGWLEGPNGWIVDEAGRPWAEMGESLRQPDGSTAGAQAFVQAFTLRADAPAGRYRIWYSVGDVLGNRGVLYGTTAVEFTVE